MGRRENAAHDGNSSWLPFHARDGTSVAVAGNPTSSFRMSSRLLRRYLTALVAKAPSPSATQKDDASMSCTLPWRSGVFAIREEPNVGGDAGVVEKLLR